MVFVSKEVDGSRGDTEVCSPFDESREARQSSGLLASRDGELGSWGQQIRAQRGRLVGTA